MLPTVANGLWWLTSLPDAWWHHRARQNIAETQSQLLLTMVRANADTVFGREHNFETIHSVANFQDRVPLLSYDSYVAYIKRIANGEKHILTRDLVQLVEPTSGSTAATKFIPYTATLKNQFNRGIAAWIVNLFRHHPELLHGQAYWSVSPVDSKRRYTAGGIPIGFEDDTDYLGSGGALLRQILAVPQAVKLLSNMDNFRYTTLLYLLQAKNLRLISVWNPTFMTILLDHLPKWGEELIRDIADGTLTLPYPVQQPAVDTLRARLAADKARARTIESALSFPAPECHTRVWEKLCLLSCWADGIADNHAQTLASLLPQARLQWKGLIATEAFVSFPVVDTIGSQLSIRSHFLEFMAEDDTIYLAHELVQGAHYRVVVSTGGGLYRYQLHDLIEALGGLQIRFVGRSANISDHFGEKISEGHVRTILKTLFTDIPAFCVLSAESYPDNTTSYTLFTSHPTDFQALERQLCENYHYDYCRRLGQLAPARVINVANAQAHQGYLKACIERGQRAGDIKSTILYKHGGLLPYLHIETK